LPHKKTLLDTTKHQGQRQHLIEVLKEKGIFDANVLHAIANVPRHEFLDSSFEEFAYRDVAFPIRAKQTISQPYTVAFQSQSLGLSRGAKVLEIGTGSGYQAAVLVEMGLKVFSIERQKDLFDFSKNILMKLGYNITQKFGDGYKGIPSYAPFDGIIVTAAAPDVPTDLLEQLSPDGSLIIPMGEPNNDQVMKRIKKSTISEGYKEEDLGSFRFVPMLKDIDSGDGF
jgi:protein-L-isoaspartate(D-aspartate) O-methyltransferase